MCNLDKICGLLEKLLLGFIYVFGEERSVLSFPLYVLSLLKHYHSIPACSNSWVFLYVINKPELI